MHDDQRGNLYVDGIPLAAVAVIFLLLLAVYLSFCLCVLSFGYFSGCRIALSSILEEHNK